MKKANKEDKTKAPKYHKNVQVTCSCGNTFAVGGSTKEFINVEYCYKCHPAYTKEKKVADTASKIKAFEARMKKAQTKQKQASDIKKKKDAREKAKKKVSQQGPLTLKDMLKDFEA